MTDHTDAQARAQALDTTRSFLVQAPAGSGKTELLIRRFLSLLAQAERPEEIVAITFTRKAAAEMLARILDALNAAHQPLPSDEHKRETRELALRVRHRDQKLKWELLSNPGRLRVETIDALCAEIAASAPVAAGGSFGRIEEDARPRYLEAAQRAIRDLASPDGETREGLRRLLLHVDGETQVLQSLIAEMLEARDQWMRYLPTGHDRVDLRKSLDRALRNTTARALREVRSAVANAIPPRDVATLLELIRFAARNDSNLEELTLWRDLRSLPEVAVENIAHWRALRKFLLKKDGDWRNTVNVSIGFPPDCRAEKAAMVQLMTDIRADADAADRLQSALCDLDRLPPLSFDDAQWQIAEGLFRVLPIAVAHLKQVFAEYDVTDFPAVSEAARRVLAAHPGEMGRTGIRHLLVDEYQDTSVTQQELLELLTYGWQQSQGRTIFVVGDPMQSIYGFRQAEVALFLQMQSKRLIGSLPLTVLRLERNFRSGAGIVSWVNDAFNQIFPAEHNTDTGAVPYAPMSPLPKSRGATEIQVHPFIGTDHAQVNEREAERVADLIARHKMRDAGTSIAILVSARSHVAAIAPKLSSRGIRVRAVEIERLNEVQVVRDLQALTRAMLHDTDRIAWLALLRGPWCGMGLDDLERLCGSRKDRYACVPELLERNLDRLTSEAQQRIARLKKIMELARARRGRVPLASLVEGTWIALGGPACVSGEALDDAISYLRALSRLERAGEIADWQRVEASLEQLFAAPDPDADGSVQIMTIHKAKGLEFDVVILPQLGRVPGDDKERLLLWREFGGEAGHPELLLAPVKAKGAEEDPLYAYLARVQRHRRKQELKRLLYVATTRARQSLHLLGAVSLDHHGDMTAPHRRSPLAQLWPIVEPEFRRAQGAHVPRQAGLFSIAASTAAPSLQRLPLAWTLAPPPVPAVNFPSAIPRAEREASAISFDWAGDLRRHVGTVVHAWLQRIAGEGAMLWTVTQLAAERPHIIAALRASGVAEALLTDASAEVEHALSTTLNDERGRWCVDAHQYAEAELSLSGVVDGKLHSIRIDRTFVSNGVRWIIDYKTGVRQGSGKESFFDKEVERYREQLAVYSALVQKLDSSLPVRAGLYFPSSAAWRELPIFRKSAGAN